MADNSALALSLLALGKASQGGGGGEPTEYLKSASVADNELTLTKKDGTTVVYEPTIPEPVEYTAGEGITIENNEISIDSEKEIISLNLPSSEWTRENGEYVIKMLVDDYQPYHAFIQGGTATIDADTFIAKALAEGVQPSDQESIWLSYRNGSWSDMMGKIQGTFVLSEWGVTWTGETPIPENSEIIIAFFGEGGPTEIYYARLMGGDVSLNEESFIEKAQNYGLEPDEFNNIWLQYNGSTWNDLMGKITGDVVLSEWGITWTGIEPIPSGAEVIICYYSEPIKTRVWEYLPLSGGTEVSGTNDGTNWTSLTIDDDTYAIPSGGGSEGAVRYDEAQTLTEAEQMQARANQGLPYNYSERAQFSARKDFAGTSTGDANVYLYWTGVDTSQLNVGDKLYLDFEYGTYKEDIDFGNYIEITSKYSSSLNGKLYSEDSNYFKDGDSAYITNTQLRFRKKDTSESGFSGNTYLTVYYDRRIFNNKLTTNDVDLGGLSKIRINANSFFGVNMSYLNDTVPNSTLYYSWNDSSKKGISSNSIILGGSNDIYNGDTNIVAIGSNLSTSARNYGGCMIGNQLKTATQQNFGLIIGYYNDEIFTNGYTGEYKSSNTYSIGDVVSDTNCYCYSSLQDNNKGHTPPSGSSNEYWHYEGSYTQVTSPYTYLFTIGNGASNSARSNALTVDWEGNLVCNNIPAPPDTDGNYVLKCSIVDGTPSYSWVAE